MQIYKLNLLSNIKYLLRFLLLLAVGVSAGLLASCEIYRVDVKQGQISVFEDAETLKTGMTRNQVMEIMGTPLVVDPFRENRWDYVYNEIPGNEGEAVNKRVTLMFDDDVLTEIIIEEN